MEGENKLVDRFKENKWGHCQKRKRCKMSGFKLKWKGVQIERDRGNTY